MGLDIVAYSHLHFLPPREDEEPDGDAHDMAGHILVYEDDFDRRDGLAIGWYAPTAGTDTFHFRAGSYSGYNRWREELSLHILGVLPRTVWHNPGPYLGKPLVELINFSDCEGIIGPVTSAKLANDCRHYASFPMMEQWLRAFTLAAHSGFVKFQ